VLVDVRTPSEYTAGHIEGAINIPLTNLTSRMSELSPAVPVLVYCASGTRSSRASAQLAAAGYVVYDLGAMSNWG
jgi:rhodanese-related sulfurtransferase